MSLETSKYKSIRTSGKHEKSLRNTYSKEAQLIKKFQIFSGTYIIKKETVAYLLSRDKNAQQWSERDPRFG